MKKRVLGILAALFVCAVLLPVGVRAADADAANVYAILYDDGTLVFQHGNTPDPGRTVTNTYEVNLTTHYYRIFVRWYNERESVRVVNFADRISPASTAYWFNDCRNLERVDNIKNLDTSNVTNMQEMFRGCGRLTTLDVSHFDTANVTSMSSMFSGCGGLTALDVSRFDTSNVTDMGSMFSGCGGLTALDVSRFDTANVTSMSSTFYGCGGLTALDVSRFDTANVTDMCWMFQGCEGLTALDVSRFDTANVTNMGGMFQGCIGLTALDVSRFDTSNVTDMGSMFYTCGALVLDVSHFDTTNVTNMSYMFFGCGGLTALDISHFNTANVTSMNRMFSSCEGLTALDVSHFDTTNVADMEQMFRDCSGLTALDVSRFDTSNVTNMSGMFQGCSGLTALDVSRFDTANVTDMCWMFQGCEGLTALDVSRFDTANVTYMYYMFSGCDGLTALDVSHFDTANVILMGWMFSECGGLTTLDVSHFDTANVTSMRNMFYNCAHLKTIYASDEFTTMSITQNSSMFFGCTSLIGGNGTEYNRNYTDKTYARIDTPSAPGYFTAIGATPVTYTVTWANYDGTVLRTDTNVVAGTVPAYDGDTPVRTGYRFTGWAPQPSAVTGDVTYTAQFEKIEQPPDTPAFDVRRDAYSFGNSMAAFGYTSRGGPGGGQYPIPAQSFFLIFGESVRAKMLYMQEASKAWAGNCAGMASSVALLFAYGQLNPADFGKSNTYSLAIGDKNAEMSVLTLVEALQIAQFTDAFGQARQANQVTSGQSLNGLYQTIKDEIAQGRPTLLAIAKEHVGGHALLAVGADDDENRILIYDCNHPGELRYMTLSADRTAWSYDMGGYGVWGSDSGACSISYVPYAVLEDIWANRGNLRQTSQVLTVNAENVSITNFDGDTVASLENGQLVTSTEGVYELVDLSMYWPEERSICLPRNEVYTVSTSDDITLSASMTDSHMSAEITTSAHTVTFGVSDDEKENSVVIQGATASDTYSITLESDFDDLRHKNLTLTGTGQGENVNVSMTQDGVTFVNCNIESLLLDACEIVSAARGRDGKLSVTLTNPNGAVLAVSYFDADGKFMSAALQAVAADAGTVSVDIPADATAARVMLFDTDCRPLCAAREADFAGGAG